MKKENLSKSLRRKTRIRFNLRSTSKLPSLVVFRSGKHIYAQIIDDVKAETLVSASDLELTSSSSNKKKSYKNSAQETKTKRAFTLGELIAKKALKKKIKKVVFDRGSYKYHGRVKALAEGSRKGGLEF